MAYNPVSNPNPENSPARRKTGVMSQGHYGNIVQRKSMPGEPMDRNVCMENGHTYGEWDIDPAEDTE